MARSAMGHRPTSTDRPMRTSTKFGPRFAAEVNLAESCIRRHALQRDSAMDDGSKRPTGVVHGLINPQYLKLLSDWGDLYRHLITLAFAQHGPA